MNSGFFYGYCPCCDKVISVPSGTDNTYCCFCGSRFLSAAAFRLYGLKETAVVLSNGKADFRSASASTPDSQKGQPSAFTKPVMMTVRELSRATGVSEYTLRRLLKQGKLPALYAGSKALINYNKVLEILDTLK
ncbi:MAG: excisionase family DNA-binding protein [Oscillospiraceae bacterium]|nr:excisionase family DNA-binding protein [Oscillospiraceae bacterium]